MAIEIREVTTRRDLKRFVMFPFELYKGNTYWIPPLIKSDMDALRRDKNPVFEYSDAKYWIAYKDGKIAGRIAGMINHKFVEKWKSKFAGFGWFEAIDDVGVSKALLNIVEEWVRIEGMEAVQGPMGLTNFDHQGMLIEGFDELPTVASTYNYPYYPVHMEAAGYGKKVDYVEFEVKVPETILDKALRISDLVMKRKGVRLYKAKSKKDVQKHAKRIFEIINETYSHLYGFVELSDKQMALYTKKYFPYMNPDLVSMLFDKNDQMVGFQITLPTLSRAMQKANGRLFPFGFRHLLKALKNPTLIDLYLVGILPEYQNQGLNAIFMLDLQKTCLELGIKLAETNSELEDNHKVQSFWKNYDARQHKRKRIFIKHL